MMLLAPGPESNFRLNVSFRELFAALLCCRSSDLDTWVVGFALLNYFYLFTEPVVVLALGQWQTTRLQCFKISLLDSSSSLR